MANFNLALLLKQQKEFTFAQKINYVWQLSLPGIFAQISSIIMQYIDAAMVGRLGANAPAAIGLVASSTWVLGGLTSAMCTGYTVQVAHAVGAGNKSLAKHILCSSIFIGFIFSLLLALLGFAISFPLPLWLGASSELCGDASFYFLIFALSTPLYMVVYLMSGMLQCSGNMKVPGFMNVLMCILDVAFNALFIFGMNLGVKGAALGSAASALVTAVLIFYFTLYKSDYLNLRGFRDANVFDLPLCKNAVRIAMPVAVEKVAFTGALVAVTKIIAPLGAVALASNSFAVTAESLCYMPGYGIGEAATTLTGQATGGKRKDLVRSFSWMTVLFGMLVMAVMGVIMYFICPAVFSLLTPIKDVQDLSAKVLRAELFAEPLYGASIVCSGALRGMGDTLVPGIMNLFSVWVVRLSLSLLLIASMGLTGIWIAMAVELCFRGIIFLIRLLVMTRK
ncbi:MAG: MATE family efflux transporter [Treponema sp.]|nr:MATE family efflux transporter [Treponema sp.]